MTAWIGVKYVQKRPITTAPGIQVSSVSWWSKALFLNSLLVSSFPAAFASFSYFTALARKSECGTFDLIGHYIVQSSFVRHYIDMRLDQMNSIMHVYHTIDQKENQKQTYRQNQPTGARN